MVEIHPFTIASVADSPNAKERATGRTSFSIWLVTIWVLRIRKVSVIVEGPYGGLGNWMKASFSAIVLVVGGSGISFTPRRWKRKSCQAYRADLPDRARCFLPCFYATIAYDHDPRTTF
ncbi:hypothetical protein F5879DRAFT_20727 [Lentinula edodes]|nr:hypothetical protein F5879DRAFT_20727 [Lentinula edodes]